MISSHEKLQSLMSRGSIILTALLLIALTSIAGCSDGGDAKADAASAASQNFMTAYYQKNSAKDGLEFCTGDAKAKVAKEVAAIAKSGVSPENSSEKPAVTLKMDGYKKLNDQQYEVSWTVQSTAGETIKVATTMVQPGDRWLVSKFVENEKK